jgi:hypothetical protein
MRGVTAVLLACVTLVMLAGFYALRRAPVASQTQAKGCHRISNASGTASVLRHFGRANSISHSGNTIHLEYDALKTESVMWRLDIYLSSASGVGVPAG